MTSKLASVYVMCFPNGKLYVGKARSLVRRLRDHRTCAKKGAGNLLYRAIRKYGWESICVIVLASLIEEKEAYRLERVWIARLNAHGSGGYNETDGGEGLGHGHPVSQRTREAVTTANRKRRGRPLSEQNRKGIRAALLRRWHDPVQRQSLIEAARSNQLQAAKAAKGKPNPAVAESNHQRKLKREQLCRKRTSSQHWYCCSSRSHKT